MIKPKASSLIHQLEQAFRVLPGVGPKSASRMVYYLLQHAKPEARALAKTLNVAIDSIGHCQQCQTLTEVSICEICASSTRASSDSLCVVANPQDIHILEQSGVFSGVYFVLNGLLSPIDGIGPADLFLDKLIVRASEPSIKEVILALSPTVEGEATIHYIKQQLKDKVSRVTRLANGVPVGGELEYLSANTIGHAFQARGLCEVI